MMRRRERVPGLTTLGVNCLAMPMLLCVVRLVLACPALVSPWLV